MAKRITKNKKLRKRDALIYAAIIAAVLAAVIVASQIIEHLPSRLPEDDREGVKTHGTADADGPGDDDLFLNDDGAPDGARNENDVDLSSLISGKYNNNIKNIVLIGVDKQELTESDFYRTGGQSDVIIVLSMNLKTKEYFMLSINRDLAVPVDNYASNGSSYGIVDEQIAISYGYGNGGRSSGRNVIKSLNWLLGSDMKFLGYIASPIPIISLMADAVDGVEVTVMDDFSGVDDTLVMGEKVTLRGKQAETFVRARMSMKESNTNALRMNRQIQFMEAFMSKAKRTMTANQLVDLYADTLDITKTDMGRTDITRWILTCYDYEFKGIYRIDGVEGEPKHDARCTYYEAEDVAALVQELYYIQE